jgi:hypothetical protein
MTPETLYDTWVSGITGIVGRKETTSSQLDEYGKALMPGFYRGAFARGDHPPPDGTRHFLIVNGMTGPPGDHWHGIYREPGQPDLVYDSWSKVITTPLPGIYGRSTRRSRSALAKFGNRIRLHGKAI